MVQRKFEKFGATIYLMCRYQSAMNIHRDSIGSNTAAMNIHRDSIGSNTAAMNIHRDSISSNTVAMNIHLGRSAQILRQ
jgi:hypothetical protein